MAKKKDPPLLSRAERARLTAYAETLVASVRQATLTTLDAEHALAAALQRTLDRKRSARPPHPPNP